MTPRYASPEQLRGEPLSTASDIYSVAATLCELLVGGTRESKRSSLAALAERAAGGTSVPRTASYPDLELVLRKAMDPDPQRRYATAIEFAEDLRACLECRPVRARRTTLPYQVSRFVARNRGGVSLVAVLMVALLGFAGYALNEQSQRLAETQRAVFIARFFISMLESSSTAHSGNPNLTVL
jgi:serine/threonine-protein kinase